MTAIEKRIGGLEILARLASRGPEQAVPGAWRLDGDEVRTPRDEANDWPNGQVVCVVQEPDLLGPHIASFDPPTALAMCAEIGLLRARLEEHGRNDGCCMHRDAPPEIGGIVHEPHCLLRPDRELGRP